MCSFFQKVAIEGGSTQLLDAVTDFANHLFRIPVPPHGRIAIVSVYSVMVLASVKATNEPSNSISCFSGILSAINVLISADVKFVVNKYVHW